MLLITLVEYVSQGPCYTSPLMGFIDENCAVFDDDEENKFEYTKIHEEFKEVVDRLISEFLEEIGVAPEQFLETVAKNISGNQLNSFVVNSILTVEDFLQFKAMMVKRNLDLTNQVLAMIENQQIEEVMKKHKDWQDELRKLDGLTDDDMLAEALWLSTEQFEGAPGATLDDEMAQALKASKLDDDTEFTEEFKEALALSMREKAALDLEKAELEQAIALSLALEQEHQMMTAAALAEAASPKAPAALDALSPPPAAALAPAAVSTSPAPSLVGTVAPASAAAATASAAAATTVPNPMALPPVSVPRHATSPPPPVAASTNAVPAAVGVAPPAKVSILPDESDIPSVGVGSKVLRGAAGYSSAGGAAEKFKGGGAGAPNVDFNAIREAAAQAAKAQKEMLLARKEQVQNRQSSLASSTGQVSEVERQRREAYLKQQRDQLLQMQKEKREQELQEYLQDHKKVLKPQGAGSSKDQEMEAKRAALRNDLARQIKQQMIAKQAEMSM